MYVKTRKDHIYILNFLDHNEQYFTLACICKNTNCIDFNSKVIKELNDLNIHFNIDETNFSIILSKNDINAFTATSSSLSQNEHTFDIVLLNSASKSLTSINFITNIQSLEFLGRAVNQVFDWNTFYTLFTELKSAYDSVLFPFTKDIIKTLIEEENRKEIDLSLIDALGSSNYLDYISQNISNSLIFEIYKRESFEILGTQYLYYFWFIQSLKKIHYTNINGLQLRLRKYDLHMNDIMASIENSNLFNHKVDIIYDRI